MIFRRILKNEEGSALIASLLLLVILTLIGIAATSTTTTDMQIASNEKSYKYAFYAAEAARGYVAADNTLYGPLNITLGGMRYFPNNADTSEYYSMSSAQFFKGEVEYIGWTAPPRGSGYSAEKYKAHRYQMTIDAKGPREAVCDIEAGFYRIGF
jgi:hypothetical protein